MKRIEFIKQTLCFSVAATLGAGLLNSCETDEPVKEMFGDGEIIKFSAAKRKGSFRPDHHTYMVVDNVSYGSTESFNRKSLVTFDLLLTYSLRDKQIAVKNTSTKTLDCVGTKDSKSFASKVKRRRIVMDGNVYDLKDYRENIKQVSMPVAFSEGFSSPITLISIKEFNQKFPETLIALI